jgi:large subunit ribosomal protein L3e
MSHRKFEKPRMGSLAFYPKRRTKYTTGKIRHFPKDDNSKPVHLTAFMGYKAGMTHVVRQIDRKEGKKTVKKDIIDAVTVIETPPILVNGVVGYIQTPRGLRALSTVWAQNLPQSLIRRFYKNFYVAKKRAFANYTKRYEEAADSKRHINRDLQRIKKYCTVVRVLVSTQIEKVKLRQRKAHLMEIQVNGGKNITEKVDWAVSKFEKEITVGEVFQDSEMVDTIAITSGHGTCGVTKRHNVTRLPRKSRRGNRKIGCIGAWHPAAVKWTVGRSGGYGYYHRTQINQKIFRVGAGAVRGVLNNASTDTDPHTKNITPVGGFPHYGVVNEDFLVLRGAVMGPKKRQITIRKSMLQPTKTFHTTAADIKFIDTSSKIGHGKFQTIEEKDKFMGPLASKQRAAE